jgi:hypothetical protein
VPAFGREALAIGAARNHPSDEATRTLDRVVARPREPAVIQLDNGPVLTSRHLDL